MVTSRVVRAARIVARCTTPPARSFATVSCKPGRATSRVYTTPMHHEIAKVVSPSVLFGKFHVLLGESAWFLARRDDAVVVSLLQEVATPPGAAMAREECIGILQTGH